MSEAGEILGPRMVDHVIIGWCSGINAAGDGNARSLGGDGARIWLQAPA